MIAKAIGPQNTVGAIGMRPSTVEIAVSISGRKRDALASITASRTDNPRSRSSGQMQIEGTTSSRAALNQGTIVRSTGVRRRIRASSHKENLNHRAQQFAKNWQIALEEKSGKATSTQRRGNAWRSMRTGKFDRICQK